MRDAVVETRTPRLRMLPLAGDAIQSAVLYQPGTGLVKPERSAGLDALPSDIDDPLVAACSRFAARLPADAYLLYAAVEPAPYVEMRQQRCADDYPVAYWQRCEYGQPQIGLPLILDRTADRHILVALAPVGGEQIGQPRDTLGKEHELQVATQRHHLPALVAPRVGLFEQEVGGKAGIYHLSAADLEASRAVAARRQIERRSAPRHAAVGTPLGVLPIDVAVETPFADLAASVPRVPVD